MGDHGRRLAIRRFRANVLPERFRDRVFHVRMPQSVTTFLVDGTVACWGDGAHGQLELLGQRQLGNGWVYLHYRFR